MYAFIFGKRYGAQKEIKVYINRPRFLFVCMNWIYIHRHTHRYIFWDFAPMVNVSKPAGSKFQQNKVSFFPNTDGLTLFLDESWDAISSKRGKFNTFWHLQISCNTFIIYMYMHDKFCMICLCLCMCTFIQRPQWMHPRTEKFQTIKS